MTVGHLTAPLPPTLYMLRNVLKTRAHANSVRGKSGQVSGFAESQVLACRVPLRGLSRISGGGGGGQTLSCHVQMYGGKRSEMRHMGGELPLHSCFYACGSEEIFFY